VALRGKKWIWALIAVLVVGFLIFRGMGKAVEVRTERAKKQLLELTVTATATGTVKSDTEVKITAQRSGRISTINVVEGDAVRKDDIIVELDPTEANINLKKAQASLAKVEAMLKELGASYDALKAEVVASIERTSSMLQDSRSRHERYGELSEKGFISKDELDTARTGYEVAKAEHEAALSGKAKLSALESEIEAQEAAVKESQEALRLAELSYSYSFLKASIDGIVTSVPVKLGERTTEGYLVAEMIAIESLYVEAFIDEADVGKVKDDQEVYITMDAFPGKTFHGKVYMISPVVLGERHETRTFEARTRVEEDVELKPGMSADIEVVVGREENTLSVPSQAVFERNGKHFAYVVEGTKARLREVQTGLFNWTLTEITAGLKETEEVIVSTDVEGLEDGVRVKIKKQ
jgi:RND family efflux transporter MFP subunit